MNDQSGQPRGHHRIRIQHWYECPDNTALHDPDMIAGGNDKINRVGNKNVNSSLGSQWKGRVSEKDRTAKEAASTSGRGTRVSEMDRAAKEAASVSGRDTKMNVELERCK